MSQNDDRKTRTRFTVKEIVFCPRSEKELKALPENCEIAFRHNLSMVAHGMVPTLDIDHLDGAGTGIIELKIDGKLAFRCVYYNKLPGEVVVLLAAPKKTNGPDPKIMKLAKNRLKMYLNRQ